MTVILNQGLAYIPRVLVLELDRAERQSARMSKNYKWRLNPIWHGMLCIAVPAWQQWASKG